jgi:hypothetical protein
MEVVFQKQCARKYISIVLFNTFERTPQMSFTRVEMRKTTGYTGYL